MTNNKNVMVVAREILALQLSSIMLLY